MKNKLHNFIDGRKIYWNELVLLLVPIILGELLIYGINKIFSIIFLIVVLLLIFCYFVGKKINPFNILYKFNSSHKNNYNLYFTFVGIFYLFKLFCLTNNNCSNNNICYGYQYNILSTLIPLLLIIASFYFSWIKRNTKKDTNDKNKGLLLSDKPIIIDCKDKTKKEIQDKAKEEDKLGYFELAQQFANNIYNNNSTDNLIFSIEAPRGSGKTSFLEFVKKSYIGEKRLEEECYIFDFNPWHFDGETSLLSNFLNDLSAFLQKDNYLPKLSNQFNELLSILGENSDKVLGFKFSLGTKTSLSDLNENINNSLKQINKKLIIIIDDIDRLPLEKAKILFKIIDLCRNFYNTSYILCYDSYNFNSIDESINITRNYDENGAFKSLTEQDLENSNLVKFLEKIVNVKFLLKFNPNYTLTHISEIINNTEIGLSSESKKNLENGFKKIFEPENSIIFGKYLGNIRHIKRFFNSLILNLELVKSYKVEQENFIDSLKSLFFSGNSIYSLAIDDYIKFFLLSMYHNDLYLDICDDIYYYSMNNFGHNISNGSKYYFKYFEEKKEDKIPKKFTEYINSLTQEKRVIMKNIFESKLEDKIQFNININNNQSFISFKYILQFLNSDFSFINAEIGNYSNAFEYFKKYLSENNLVGLVFEKQDIIVKFLSFVEQGVKSEDLDISKFNLILDFIYDNFHQFSINTLGTPFDNIFRILYGYNDKNPDKIIDVKKLIYGSDDYNSLLSRFFDNKWGIKGVYNAIGLIKFSLEQGYYSKSDFLLFNYDKLVIEFTKLFEKYIKDINIFDKIYNLDDKDFEKIDGIESWGAYTKEKLIYKFIVYLISENGIIRKKEDRFCIEEYIFNCFEKNVGYFVEFILFFIRLGGKNPDTGKDKYFDFDGPDWSLTKSLNKDKFLSFYNKNIKEIEEYINKRKNESFKTFDTGFDKLEFTYGEGFEIIKVKINSKNNKTND